MKLAVYVPVLIVLLVGKLPAKEWARKIFETTNHDFGTVARGSKAEFEFPLENIYLEDLHIANVRSSCGCSTAEITKPTLKTWENGSIRVKYNTRSFLGYKNATITVTIDKPYFAEVQLTVSGYIRSDVVIKPGSVEFGEVELGTPAEKKLSIIYAGREDWKIVDVRSDSGHLQAAMTETKRGGGRVAYDLVVRLKEDAPAGYINEQLILVTNDQRNTKIPLMAVGRVLSPVTVSPAALAMGVVESGHQVTKQLVVRAKKPFRITAVRCDDDCFVFKISQQAKRLHLVPVTFTADKARMLSETIEIETDLAPKTSVSCVVTATVKSRTPSG